MQVTPAKPSREERRTQFSLRGMIITTAAICGTMAILGALQISPQNIMLGFGIFGSLALVLILLAETFNRISGWRRNKRIIHPGTTPFGKPTDEVDWITERGEELRQRREAEGGVNHDASGGDLL